MYIQLNGNSIRDPHDVMIGYEGRFISYPNHPGETHIDILVYQMYEIYEFKVLIYYKLDTTDVQSVGCFTRTLETKTSA
jgi:hypothetical protein